MKLSTYIKYEWRAMPKTKSKPLPKQWKYWAQNAGLKPQDREADGLYHLVGRNRLWRVLSDKGIFQCSCPIPDFDRWANSRVAEFQGIPKTEAEFLSVVKQLLNEAREFNVNEPEQYLFPPPASFMPTFMTFPRGQYSFFFNSMDNPDICELSEGVGKNKVLLCTFNLWETHQNARDKLLTGISDAKLSLEEKDIKYIIYKLQNIFRSEPSAKGGQEKQ